MSPILTNLEGLAWHYSHVCLTLTRLVSSILFKSLITLAHKTSKLVWAQAVVAKVGILGALVKIWSKIRTMKLSHEYNLYETMRPFHKHNPHETVKRFDNHKSPSSKCWELYNQINCRSDVLIYVTSWCLELLESLKTVAVKNGVIGC